MNNDAKRKFLIIVSIFLAILALGVTAYAYYSAKEIFGGSFDVDITSKGVDVFDIKASRDISFYANGENFAYQTGSDISGSAYIDVSLNTTKKEAQYCYEVNFKMPDKEVFTYSNYPKPELLLDIEKIENGNKTTLISQMDVTRGIGSLKVPVNKESDNYLHKISTTKNNEVIVRYEATLTLVYFPEVNQSINQHKRYDSSIKVNIASCE